MTTPISVSENRIFVYEWPLRVWHWINALTIVVLSVTGILIASPLPSVGGEASEHFLMGYIRFVHFAAAYILIVGFLFRCYWAYAGNKYARQLLLPPLHKLKFWEGVMHELLWYAFLVKHPRNYNGHNPLATLFMHFILLWGTVFMIITGLALYGEGAGQGSWQFTLFSSWVIPLFGQSQDVHSWHHLIMWYIICFIIAHIYVAIREDKMSGQTMLKTMVTGWREFENEKPADDDH